MGELSWPSQKVKRLLGAEHTMLTWRNNGIDRRLTDIHGHIFEELIA